MVLNCGEEKNNEKSIETELNGVNKETDKEVETTKTILCFGDSITAGYGLEDNADAYPALLQQKIDSLNLDYTVINSGLSGETSAGGRSRIDWVMRQPIDIFLLELGGNDGLRGIPLTETKSNLQSIINSVNKKNPNTKIILAGMELPPNMGQDFTSEFRSVFAQLAKENDVTFIPFILKDVGGIKELNQPDGIHPTTEGHKIVANTVWDVLKPMLQSNSN
ncbi:arylesterase [Winogradskyella alexanderae]|uniref:Arylesterase n=1 Tax=Winogradskyella alexanderae TaxID=2877123 RepID=A0ABS7XSJ1_9FLAO|nr:arylesterase [Winogradskyella alexanderae]MCA0132735.1 arylesterase [Winogradskyella alexanderae]